MDGKLAERVTDAAQRRADWLEGVLAGLLVAGVPRDEIEVQEHPEHSVAFPGGGTVVAVRGVPRYQYRR